MQLNTKKKKTYNGAFFGFSFVGKLIVLTEKTGMGERTEIFSILVEFIGPFFHCVGVISWLAIKKGD